MSKSIYDKWREVLDTAIEDSSIMISNYFLSLSTKTQLYIGKSNKYQFIFLEFGNGVLDNVELPELKGVEISLSQEASIDKTKEYIKIRNKTDNTELFIAFSSSLCDALIDTHDYQSVFVALDTVIKEYRAFFTSENHSLTLQEEQGLCAELLELSRLIDVKGEDAVQCWAGPSMNKRDFLFDTKALEIKSTLGQVDSSILISNENQLDYSYPPAMTDLYLKVYIFEKVNAGFNIISCAQEVLAKLVNINNRTYFMVNLLKMKVDLNSYKCKYNFSQQFTRQYKVYGSFPRITQNMLSKGVFNVKYRIHLDALLDYEITEEDLYGQL